MADAVARRADARPLSLPAKLALAAEVVRAYGAASWRLRRRGLRGALEALRRVAPARGPSEPEADPVAAGRRLGYATARTLALLPADSRCLMQSLVLTRLLARRGIDCELVIAVEPGVRFGAHAWLEHDGAALLPPAGSEFEQLVRL